jgi:hypothetical protein
MTTQPDPESLAQAGQLLCDCKQQPHCDWCNALIYTMEPARVAVAAALAELRAEIRGLLAFKASVDEALNMGDGSYRP